MVKKQITYLLIALLLISAIIPVNLPAEDNTGFLKNWDFNLKIEIPIDTSEEQAKFQPIDIHVEFDNPCWAKDKQNHSIRVYLQEGGRLNELESQIYDLNHTDGEYINSCNLVFLIPEEASGNEEYFIYYDDEEKANPKYNDYVSVDESHYSFYPVRGIGFESWFYRIKDGEYFVYSVSKKGSALDEWISQQVAIMKKGTTEVLPKTGEQLASFNTAYWWRIDECKWEHVSSSENLVSSEIIEDGNLMVKFGIKSSSFDGHLRSKVIYKYYHCPTDDKRIRVQVKHEIDSKPLPTGDEIDVAFALLTAGGIKSKNIEDLNFGEIYPYMHLNEEEEGVKTFNVDTDPEGVDLLEIVGKKDDVDLDDFAWVSADKGENAKAHSIIFNTNKVVKTLNNENNGIEVQGYESSPIQLPGLDSGLFHIYLMRNDNEPGRQYDTELPEHYVAEYSAEFFTTEDGDYKTVEKEAIMFQTLVFYQPESNEDIGGGSVETPEYNLTIYVFLPQSLILKYLSSGLLLRNPYIQVEAFKEDSIEAFGMAGRLAFTEDFWFDWENISLFRKIQFPPLQQGKYVVKVKLKNSLFGDEEGEFIGYDIIELEDDKSISIICKPQGKISISLLNQNDNGIKDAKIFLMKDDEIITKGSCGIDGKITITAPSGFSETYTLKMLYKGFLIIEEEVRLGVLRRIIPLTKSYKINVSDLEIKIFDSNGEIPDFKIYIGLTSDEMETSTTLIPDTDVDGVYKFLKLYHAYYNLKINFNSFEIEKLINISETTKIEIDLYDLNLNVKDKWDLPFNTSLDVTLTSKELEKTVQLVGNRLADNHYHFTNLYPGNYLLKIGYKAYVLEENVTIPFEPDSTNTITFPALMDLEVVVYDSHGNSLSNKDVIISRNGKEIENDTDDEGKTTFQVPPGRYDLKIFSNDNLIAKRKIDVLNHVKYDIATIEEPLTPFLIMGAAVIILIGFVLHSYKRKEYGFFIIILSLMLVFVAVISPWWAISSTSSESEIENFTNMYLTPTEMITITSNDMIAGELASHDDTFAFYVGLLPVLITIGMIIMLVSMIFIKIKRKKLSILLSVITVLIFIGSITIFFMAMSEFANITVGSLFGSGELEINIPGENIYVTLTCNWGLSTGFYLMLFSTIILLILTVVRIKKKI